MSLVFASLFSSYLLIKTSKDLMDASHGQAVLRIHCHFVAISCLNHDHLLLSLLLLLLEKGVLRGHLRQQLGLMIENHRSYQIP